jgi:hypothetical protein
MKNQNKDSNILLHYYFIIHRHHDAKGQLTTKSPWNCSHRRRGSDSPLIYYHPNVFYDEYHEKTWLQLG